MIMIMIKYRVETQPVYLIIYTHVTIIRYLHKNKFRINKVIICDLILSIDLAFTTFDDKLFQ